MSTPTITSLGLPIGWTSFGWPEQPRLGDIALATDDPRWSWSPESPAFGIHTMVPVEGTPVDGFTVDHVVLLVPDLDAAVVTLARIGLAPRLRMRISGNRPAAFFRAGTVLEVIETPVRAASLYGLAVTCDTSLEALALAWKSLGLDVGDIRPAMQEGRRIMTVRGLDAGFAVMSPDRAVG
jgi:hypothetical protein